MVLVMASISHNGLLSIIHIIEHLFCFDNISGTISTRINFQDGPTRSPKPPYNRGMQYHFPIFENLCPSWGEITHLGIRRVFQKGSEIIGLTTPTHGIYYVMEGSVEVPLYAASGPEKVLFFVGPGCIFGEISCFVTGEEHDDASVKARSNCVLYYFSRDVIENTITNHHPQLLIELIRATSYKNRMFSVLFRDILNSDNFIRVCKMLVYLVQFKGADRPGGKQISFDPEMTQSDLARLMGVHRVTVSKAISKLKEQGVLTRFTKKSLQIADYPALLELSSSD